MDIPVRTEPIDQELRRRQLARRLVAHRARTQTIFLLTGLSRHQLATLRQRWRVTGEMRHRGPPPTSFAVFLSTLRKREEAAALAVHWRVLESVGIANDKAVRKMTPVELGERLCAAFESYLACFPKSALDLEHLVLLVRGLEQADTIALSRCNHCEAVTLADLLEARRRLCSHCQGMADAAVPTEPRNSFSGIGEASQQELF